MLRFLPDRKLSRKVWILAGPVVVGMISQTLLNVVDTAMVGRLGSIALAAAGLGGILSWTVLGSIGALHIGVQTVASRRFGEKRFTEAGKTLDNAIMIALIVGLFCSGVVSEVVVKVFHLFTDDPTVVSEGKGYLVHRLMGALPFMIIMAHRGFFNGIGETHLHMKVSIAINASNVLFNYLFIFGNFGFPRMETAGAGLASTLGTTIGMLMFVVIGLNHKRRKEFNYYHRSNLDRTIVNKLLNLSSASGVRIFLAMMGFSFFSAIVSRLGTVEMASTNVILTIISMSFLPGAGFGTAAGSLIGQKLGEGKPDEAEEFGWESARLGVITMGVMGIIFILVPDLLLQIFTSDSEVIRVGSMPLRMMGFVQIFDAMGMVMMGSLEGAGMNKFVMYAEIAVNWLIFLPSALIFSHIIGWGLLGAWSAMGLYILILGVIVTHKYIGGSWKEVQV